MELADIIYMAEAHRYYPAKPSKAVRKWDNKTPYFIHSLLCAAMISTETKLDG